TAISLRIPLGGALRWHRDLADALVRAGHAPCRIDAGAFADRRADRTVAARIERAVYRLGVPADAPVPPDAIAPLAQGSGDEPMLDLAGGAAGPSVINILFDGSTRLDAARSAILAGRAPWISVVRAQTGEVLAAGLPALPRPDLLADSLDAVTGRAILLACQALSPLRPDSPSADPDGADAARRPVPALVATGVALGRRVVRRLARRAIAHPSWRVGYRPLRDDGVADRLAWPPTGYAWIANPPGCYLADPILHMRDGVPHLFVEVFDEAAGRAHLGVIVIDADGRVAPVRTVLKRPYHLSYPFVFDRDGETWMIPETMQARTVELYRAVSYPDSWELEQVLLSDVDLSDVTPVDHGGLSWLFATATHGGSCWDTLDLYMAEHWRGPYRPHRLNPVLIDARAARPAGPMQGRDGNLLRPAQDCTRGYGSALALCRVDRLDPDGYAQTRLSRLGPPLLGDSGVHTLATAGGFEAIDALSVRLRT
ncbi:MAG: glucosamine inositolphosphorylceramide transferase family protein, partial [Alsobacter sp.]